MVTGIVRRVDELGRVVIPKEMRRTLRIKEGEELEVSVTEKGEILLKKYSAIKDLSDYAAEIATAIKKNVDGIILITDTENVVASEGILYKGKCISQPISSVIDGRKAALLRNVSAVKDGYIAGEIVVCPVCVRGDALGCVVIISAKASEGIMATASLAADVLAAYLQ